MLAGDLKALNESRRDMTDRVVDEAMAKVEQTDIRGIRYLLSICRIVMKALPALWLDV